MTPTSRLPPTRRRRRLLALLVAAPTIMTALGVTALEAWRFHRPNAPLFVTPPAHDLADAITRDDVQRAYAFIRAGQDPRELIAVRHPVLTGGRRVRVSPLLWAVAWGSDWSVPMLLGLGAPVDATTLRRARCLAEQLRHDDIARLLALHGGGSSPEQCSTPDVGDAGPLGALAEPE